MVDLFFGFNILRSGCSNSLGTGVLNAFGDGHGSDLNSLLAVPYKPACNIAASGGLSKR
jgi:hypothetical protein